MNLLLVNKGNERLVNGGGKPLSTIENPSKPISPKRPWWDLILEHLVNVGVMAGMGFLAAFVANPDAGWKGLCVGAAVAALVELRKYWPGKIA